MQTRKPWRHQNGRQTHEANSAPRRNRCARTAETTDYRKALPQTKNHERRHA